MSLRDPGLHVIAPSRTLVGHSDRVWCVDFNGGVMASGGGDVTVRLFDVASGQCTHTIGAADCAAVVAVQLALPTVFFAAGAVVYSFSVTGGGPTPLTVPTSQQSLVLCMAVAAPLIYAGYQDGVIRVWKNGVCKGRYTGHTKDVRCVRLVGHAMYSGSEDQTVIRWNTNTAKPSVLFRGVNGPIRDLLVHGDDLYLANGQFVRMQKVSSGNLVHNMVGHSDVVVTLALDTVSNILFSGGADKRVAVWRDGASLGFFHSGAPEIVKSLRLHNGALFAAVSTSVYSWDVTHIAAALGTSQIAAAVDVLAQLTYSDQFGFASGDDIDGVGFAEALLGGGVSEDATLFEMTMAFPAPPTEKKLAPKPLPRPKTGSNPASVASPATLPRPRPQAAAAPASAPATVFTLPRQNSQAAQRALPVLPPDETYEVDWDTSASPAPLRRPLPPGPQAESPSTSPEVPRPLPRAAFTPVSPPHSPPADGAHAALPGDGARPLPPLVTSPPTLRRPLPTEAPPLPRPANARNLPQFERK
jgi:hypothetical protein